MDLDSLRNEIDKIDQEVILRLNERVRLASEIGKIKHDLGQDFYVPSREEQVFEKLSKVNQGPLDENAIRSIYRQIISAAIALEKSLKIGYLGPEATYTHQAAIKNFGSSLDYVALTNISDIFAAVERGELDYGVVPIENSTEGAVFHSFDMLAETDLKIVAQIYLEISHCLISQSPLEKIRKVLSKDNAIGQCRQWLNRYLPHAELVDCTSTSKAVLEAKADPEVAAIASRLASELYGVPVVTDNIQDRAENITRFLVVSKTNQIGPALGGGRDKTSIVFTVNNEPGALLRTLEPFSRRGLNLSKIESRPSRKKAWDYFFFIDVIGHCHDPEMKEAVEELKQVCPMVKWLGTYPDNRKL